MIRRLLALYARLTAPAPPDYWLALPDAARWTPTEGTSE